MKKQNWLVLPLAILLVFGLAFLGCDNSTSPTNPGTNPNDPVGPTGPTGDPDDGSEWYHVLARDGTDLELVLGDNFEYGEGYQGQIGTPSLFEGEKVLRGATYWLKATFTASRDLEEPLYAGLVDTSESSGWWFPLTWDGDDEDDEGTLIVDTDDDGVYEPTSLEDGYVIPAGTKISGLFKFVAINGATSADTKQNILNFQTKGAGDPGTDGSGEEGPVTLIFTELIFAKADEYDDEKANEVEVTEPPAPAIFDITVNGVTQEVTAALIGANTVLEGIEDGYKQTGPVNYQGDYVYFPVDLGVGKKLSDYASVKFTGLGTGPDATYKAIQIWASTTAFSGALWSTQPIVGPGVSNSYTSGTQTVTVAITGASADTQVGNAQNIYMVIYWPVGNETTADTVLQVTNIELVLAVAPGPCLCGSDDCECADANGCNGSATDCDIPLVPCDCNGDICGCDEKGDCTDASECTTVIIPYSCECGGEDCGVGTECTEGSNCSDVACEEEDLGGGDDPNACECEDGDDSCETDGECECTDDDCAEEV